MESMTIGGLARRAGVNIQTIRYYERRGLIPEPPRLMSGYRLYGRDDVSRIQFIKNAKKLGFSLREIAEFLSLRVDPVTTCRDVKERIQLKIAELDEKIGALEEIKKALLHLAFACKGKGPTSECPILEALDRNSVPDARDMEPRPYKSRL